MFYKELMVTNVEDKISNIEQTFIGAQGSQESVTKILDAAKNIRSEV